MQKKKAVAEDHNITRRLDKVKNRSPVFRERRVSKKTVAVNLRWFSAKKAARGTAGCGSLRS
jgi:hypothetical protein